MSRNINQCIEPQIYTSSNGGDVSLEEERAILLVRFSDKDLDPESEKAIQEHPQGKPFTKAYGYVADGNTIQ